MKQNLLLLVLSVFCLPYSSFSQEYSYTHYGAKDGLAGSNVYCITQDKEGFLWMGTEGGVSRFDGTHFKNFDLEDGLPDIEVLQIFADSRDRVWMGPFSKSICFYYKGKIHNKDNDTLLRQLSIKGNIHSFAENWDGDILVGTQTAVYCITAGGQVHAYDSVNGHAISCAMVSSSLANGAFLVHVNDGIYEFSAGNFRLLYTLKILTPFPLYLAMNGHTIAWRESLYKYRIRSSLTGRTDDFVFEGELKHVSFSLVGDSLVYRNETLGVSEYNISTRTRRTFNLGVKISRTFRDDEGNTWFCSIGQGVFRLRSEEFRNIALSTRAGIHCSVHTIRKIDSFLYVGTTYNSLFRFALPSFKDAGSYQVDSAVMDELNFIVRLRTGKIFIGTSNRIYRFFFNTPNIRRQIDFNTKSAVLKNDSEALFATAYNLVTVDVESLRVKDTLWNDRCTVVNYIDGLIYVGTLNGLYVINKDRSVVYWGERDRALRKRISAIEQARDGTLWITTYGDGMVTFRNGVKTASYTRRQGLSSDLCRTLRLQDSIVWVGTDKGLNKIDLRNPEDPITVYTVTDGLGSDIINSILTDGPMVYVGTEVGLSYFNATRVDKTAGCRLALLGLISSGKDLLADSNVLKLPYTDNNIRFEFAGTSYKSSGNIWYHYRLLGLDSTWKSTKESFLEYPTLPYGDYTFQLQAINKFGLLSREISLHFTVAAPFWRTTWFYASMLILFLFLTWLFVTLRIKDIRRRQDEKEELFKRMAETEHIALQAQMNPHFIFNCLNSIQQYIFDQDILAANKYITGFAKLIRSTLQNSSKPLISLADEIAYLSSYLSLEKLRFKDKMNYSIELSPDLDDPEHTFIPPMLIQPYVENSMRHGLRHRKGGGGYIRLNVRQQDNNLVIVIEDNGIGRQKAASYKTREHIEYQSKGMSLTADRIRLIKEINGESIKVEVVDLKDAAGEATGTRVMVWFPRFDSTFKNTTDDQSRIS